MKRSITLPKKWKKLKDEKLPDENMADSSVTELENQNT